MNKQEYFKLISEYQELVERKKTDEIFFDKENHLDEIKERLLKEINFAIQYTNSLIKNYSRRKMYGILTDFYTIDELKEIKLINEILFSTIIEGKIIECDYKLSFVEPKIFGFTKIQLIIFMIILSVVLIMRYF